jgi:hypothetical protein
MLKRKKQEQMTKTQTYSSNQVVIPKIQTCGLLANVSNYSMNEGVLEKIFFDHEYPIRVSPTDAELQLIGRYERKK